MADINLLPPEFKEEEEKILKEITNAPASDFSFPEKPIITASAAPTIEINKPTSPIIPTPPLINPKPTPAPLPERKLAPAPVKTNPVITNSVVNKNNLTKPELPVTNSTILGWFDRVLKFFTTNKKTKLLGSNLATGAAIMDVNLISEDQNLLPNKKIYNRFWLTFFLSLLLVAVLYFGAKFYGQRLINQEEQATSALSNSEQRYNKLKQQEDKWAEWRKNVDAVQVILSKHIYWSNIFKQLEKMTIPEVYYSSINASIEGSITLSASAENYLAVARQYLAYQKFSDTVSKVSFSALAGDANTGKVNFTVSLFFLPEAYFIKQ